MYGLLNIASLLLGLAAWTLPTVVMIRRRPVRYFFGVSFSLCSLSVLCQILYTHHLVIIQDWSALEDTHGAVVFCSLVLLAVTAVLNLTTLLLTRPKA